MEYSNDGMSFATWDILWLEMPLRRNIRRVFPSILLAVAIGSKPEGTFKIRAA